MLENGQFLGSFWWTSYARFLNVNWISFNVCLIRGFYAAVLELTNSAFDAN